MDSFTTKTAKIANLIGATYLARNTLVHDTSTTPLNPIQVLRFACETALPGAYKT